MNLATQSMKKTYPGMFGNIPQNVWPEYLVTFPRMFGNIPWNVLQHFPECFATFPECFTTFPRMFSDTPRNVLRHSLKCLATFPGMFGNIPRNVWEHSPEYNIPPIPCVPRIPFPVPVFLLLYIAYLLLILQVT